MLNLALCYNLPTIIVYLPELMSKGEATRGIAYLEFKGLLFFKNLHRIFRGYINAVS